MSDFSLAWFIENSRIITRDIGYYCENLSEEQLNWKPNNSKWSIAQCLDHLIRTNTSFIPIFKTCEKDSYKLPYRWIPWLPQKIGAKILAEMAPGGKPMFSPRSWRASKTDYSKSIFDDFITHQQSLTESVKCLINQNTKTKIIASPVFQMIHYNLHDVLYMIIYHEKRHLEQIKRLLNHMDFPPNKVSLNQNAVEP